MSQHRQPAPKAARMLLILSGWLLLLLLLPLSTHADEPVVTPAGAEEPFESTLFDLYLSDRFEGLILTRFTNEWFEIDEPDAALDQLPLVKDRAAVTALLTGRIYGAREISGVGKVSISVETFRLIVILESQLLSSKPVGPLRILGEPESGWALRQDLRTTYTGSYSEDGDEEQSGAFRHRTMAGQRKSWLDFDGTIVQDSDYELDALSANSIIGKSRLRLGYLRTLGQRFGGSVDFLGGTWETAQELLLDDEALRGSRLEVFIPSRSRVEFFRGGRLLDVQLLEFGLQSIDTSRFPQGSYDVEIVINESNGNVTRERRFFTKSGLLAVEDFPSVTLQGGVLRETFTVEDIPVYQLSSNWRALSFLQLEGSIYGTDELAIGSAGLLGLFRGLYFSGGFTQSTESKRGVYGDISLEIYNLNLGGNYSGTLDGEVVDRSSNEEEEDNGIFTLKSESNANVDTLTAEEQLNNIARNRQTMGAYAFYRIGELEIRYDANRNTDEEDRTRYSFGPAIIWRILEDAKRTVRFETSYLRTDGGDTISAIVSFQYRFSPWMVSSQLSARSRDNKDDHRLVTTANYDTKNRAGLGTRARISQETQYYVDDLGAVNSVEARHVNRFIDAGAFIRDTRASETSSTAYGVQADTSLILGSELALRLTNPADYDAVVVARLDSATATTPMELVINGADYGELLPGDSLAVGLSPYRPYQISLRPSEKSELIAYEPDPINLSLFPGNVVLKEWKIERVFIALGRIVDKSGAPISRARLKNLKDYVVTEDDGSFQAEISGAELIEIKTDEHHCQVALPDVGKVDYYHDFGTLTCSE